MSRTTWIVSSPYCARVARSWPLALDFICQDIKTAEIAAGASESGGDAIAWRAVRRYAEERAPFSFTASGVTFRIERRA